MTEDFGTPIRDIVIETRVDVRHIREALDKISECIKDHDDRLRKIEIDGSKAAVENADNVVKLTVRVKHLETISEECQVEKEIAEKQTLATSHWVDSLWVKIGIISGMCFGFLAFLREMWSMVFH